MFGVERIDGCAYSAQRRDGVESNRIFGHVWAEYSEDFAFLKSSRGQARSYLLIDLIKRRR